MTYAELFNAVGRVVTSDVNFCVEVESWRRYDRYRNTIAIETRWSVYVASATYEGPTALAAWEAFVASRVTPHAELLAETSASVALALE